MSITSSRARLVKPAPEEDYDVGVVNANTDLIDRALGAVRSTSTTRPSQPFDGMLTRDSETGQLLWWDVTVTGGGDWRPAGGNITLATSATRPTGVARRSDLMVFEVDTKRMIWWDGAIWRYVGDRVTVAVEADLSTVVAPYSALVAYVTATNCFYRWVRDTLWVPYQDAGGGIAPSTRSDCHYISSVGQAIPNQTNRYLAFGVADRETDIVKREIDESGIGHKFTLNRAGIWAITAMYRWSPIAATGARYGALTLNGANGDPLAADDNEPPANYTGNVTLTVGTTRFLSAGAVIRALCYQDTGSELQMVAGWTKFSAVWLRA